MRILSLIALGLSLLVAAPASATPHCRTCPYSCSDLGLGKKDCSFVSEARGVCCVDLTQKGLELAAAQEAAAGVNGGRPNVPTGQCPSGFRPSEQKCSPAERLRGCKDMRLPSGLGCVKR
jgi:hypothetical protein